MSGGVWQCWRQSVGVGVLDGVLDGVFELECWMECWMECLSCSVGWSV